MEIYSEYCQRYTLTTTQIWRMHWSVAVEADHHWRAATMQSLIVCSNGIFCLIISLPSMCCNIKKNMYRTDTIVGTYNYIQHPSQCHNSK